MATIRKETEDSAEFNLPMKGRNRMKQRLISAFFGIIVLVLVLLGNQLVFDVVVTLIASMAIYEVVGAVGLRKFKALTTVAMLMPAAMMLASHYIETYTTAIIFAFLALFMLMMLFNHKKYTFVNIATVFAVSTMVSLPFLYVSMTRRLGNENLDVLVILIGCWITDSCAYFTGYFFGKHKLAPEISPKKTIEGSVGGAVGVMLILVAYAHIAGNIMDVGVNTVPAIAVGLVAGIVSQFGDLCASIIKREHNIKDFGNIMPGHGGVMDRFDSLILVAPSVYYILKFFPIFVK